MKKKSPWIKIEDSYDIPEGEEVIGYNPAWIDEDFNPNGTRVGFFNEVWFISAESTHRIATELVQKKEMITTFFKKMERSNENLLVEGWERCPRFSSKPPDTLYADSEASIIQIIQTNKVYVQKRNIIPGTERADRRTH